MNEGEERLLKVWAAHDQRCLDMPRRPPATYGRNDAVAMNAAVRAVAEQVGMTTNEYRGTLMEYRRAGRSRVDAVKLAAAGASTTGP